tara:strand:- start:3909 stop:4880 length:972 start_codon:yes stop_codon:yes gene_type:complete
MEERKNRVILIDALNMFIRSYVINPTLDAKGRPIGGVIGFMKSLQKVCRELRPHEVIVCWDGLGGSQKRKAQNKNYKAGRKPLRFNRRMIELDPEAQEQNRIYQLIRLHEYLNEMPVIQLTVDGVEADDIIAHAVNHSKYTDWERIIISSDRDFFQLCNAGTVVYRPIQNEVITRGMLTMKEGIHPCNYALARAIVGDKSDNLPGINRVGMKTVAKIFSFLEEAKQYDVEDIINHCESVEKKAATHRNIIEGKEIIQKNYNLMQLYSPLISYTNKKSIDYNINEFEPEFNKTNIFKMLIEDGHASFKLDNLYAIMKSITRRKK